MGTLDFEGLRQAFLDPDSRIKEIEEFTGYPLVIGMNFQGGFLDGHTIHFNKNLNCLIGSRGTGKSTIIEFLRYVLNNSPDGTLQKVETQRQGLIRYTIEAYSQEEVVEIAKKPSIQLDMIDNHANIKDLVTEKEIINKKLKKNAKELGEHISQVEEWSTEVAQLSLINHQLKVLDEIGLKDRLKNQRVWGKRQKSYPKNSESN